jgi:hypothetical protein
MVPKRLCMIVLMVTGATLGYAQRPSNLLGTWNGTMQGYAVTLVLKADGSLEFQGMAGTWRAQGNRLHLTEDGETIAYYYRLQGSQLELSGGGLTAPLVLTRSGGGTPAVRPGMQAAKTGTAMPRAPGRKPGLSQAEIVELLNGGVPASRITDLVKERGIAFAMTPELASQLRAKGASPDLIQELNWAGRRSAAAGQGDCYMMSAPGGKTVPSPGCRGGTTPAGRGAGAATTPSATGIFINGRELTPKQVQELRALYGGVGPPGRYWYDRMNGSWGREGGPTEGFIMAGHNLGGPLREDVSKGDTGVFINGRQLHRVDVDRLRQIGPVYPGRCWMDAQGNIGLEGQPAFGNVWAAARARGRGGRKEGILSTYDKTGIAVFGP